MIGGLELFAILQGMLDQAEFSCQKVTALENHIHACRRDHQLLVAREVENGLDLMGDGLDTLEVQKRSQPFDGVKGAKHTVDHLHAAWVAFKRQHLHFDLREVFPCFYEEVRDQLRVIAQRYGRGRRRRAGAGHQGILQFGEAAFEQPPGSRLRVLCERLEHRVQQVEGAGRMALGRLGAQLLQRADQTRPRTLNHQLSSTPRKNAPR